MTSRYYCYVIISRGSNDHSYIRDCKDAREMEKIVHILRSNEEGYFPELTQCAEEKLKELKPQSRLFRIEEPIKGREALNPNEIKPIYEWNHDIKTTDKKLKNLKNTEESHIPPIRQMGCISQIMENKEKSSGPSNSSKHIKKSQRIKSTDYGQWDKYDVEEEILRLDLAEERKQEEVERKNRLNAEKFIKEPLKIMEIKEDLDSEKLSKQWSHLTDIEREKLSEEYRLRGNEYYRAKEFDNALNEYTRAIEISQEKAIAAYNNRALIYFKQQKYLDSIEDCEKCLKLEPNNLKARLRLAEASYAYGRRRESYQLYNNVLQLDAENSVALKAIEELRKQFEDLPPPNATRLLIQDQSSKNGKNLNPEIIKTKLKPKSINYDYDLADLVKPNRIVKNKLFKAAETLTNQTNQIQNDKKIKEKNNDNKYEMRLPGKLEINRTIKGKKLIEEL
ncbi:sperm-associated antigen 1-like isoform 2-T2 [Cochliomyia hominivorax]